MAPGGCPSLGLLSGTRWVPCLLRHRTPLKVRDSFSEQHATVGPGIAHIHTHGAWTRHTRFLVSGWHACGLHSWTAGQCGQWTVGRAARTQESASLRKRVLCTRRVKRPSWVYYVLGAAVKTDQKSRAAQRHCWDRVGIRGNI